jgi:ABC-type phosphate/phosphonate transport system permease subunit
MLSALAIAIVGLLCGGILGVVLGFSVASHRDVLRGVRPNTKNRLILFLARPTAEMNAWEGVVFFLLMVLWLGVFFTLLALPGIAAGRLSGDGPPLELLAIGSTAVAWWLGHKFGAHAWRVMA